jgi:ATP/maltotriose-dependent transcriptional regulator MalT
VTARPAVLFSPTEGFMMTVAKNSCDVDSVTQHGATFAADHANCALSPQTQPSRSAAKDKTVTASSVFAREVRMGYGLLQAAIEEAAETVESSSVVIAAELGDLQERAIHSIRESALATLDLFEALSAAQTPAEFAGRHLALAQRQRETVNERLVEFFESARNIVSIMTGPLNRQLQALTCAKPAGLGAAEGDDSILARLNTLTARQKMVLALLAEGLPNKVIAHKLGISETTVKAHVGEILRKLKVYNRARAIVMLAQFDMRQIQSLPNGKNGESQ